jgi:hypothetical protein
VSGLLLMDWGERMRMKSLLWPAVIGGFLGHRAAAAVGCDNRDKGFVVCAHVGVSLCEEYTV